MNNKDTKISSNLLLRIPKIDYDIHDAYGGLYGDGNVKDCVLALWRFIPAFLRFLVLALLEKSKHIQHNKISIDCAGAKKSALFNDMSRDGISILHIDTKKCDALLSELAPTISDLQARRKSVPLELRSYDDSQLKLKDNQSSKVYEIVGSALGTLGVSGVCRELLPSMTGEIKAITLQINDAGEHHWKNRFEDIGLEDSPINYLHIDTGVGTMKSIIYLSNVGAKNGAFRYVFGSHRIELGWVEGIIRRAVDYSQLGQPDPHNRQLFNSLPRFLQRKADFGKDVMEPSRFIKQVLAKEKDMTGKVGDVVVFDNSGLHRGGMVEHGQRIILQVILK